MGLKAGIIGLPNVGKTTLFNALTKGDALAANYPFATIEPNKGVVNVFDSRLDFLTELYHPKKTTPTSFEFIDIAGLVKGASTGEGLGNQFLSHIRNVDAICHVVRAFSDVNVTHVDGSVDPIRDISTINYELSLSDEDIVIKRIQKIEKKALTGDKEAAFELNCLKKIKECIDNLEDPKKLSFDKEEALLIKNYNLLTLKPVIYIFNILDSELSNLSSNKFYNQIVTYFKNNSYKASYIFVSSKLEEDLSSLSLVERNEYLEMYDLKQSSLDTVIAKTYNLLGLKTYLTSGPDECRAWTFIDGMNAKECAGIIHSDFEKGFIRAEILSYEDLYKYKSYIAAKENGKVRLEGKEYKMQDGDIVVFRFNV